MRELAVCASLYGVLVLVLPDMKEQSVYRVP